MYLSMHVYICMCLCMYRRINTDQKSEEETSEEHRIVKKRITFWKRQQHVGAEC